MNAGLLRAWRGLTAGMFHASAVLGFLFGLGGDDPGLRVCTLACAAFGVLWLREVVRGRMHVHVEPTFHLDFDLRPTVWYASDGTAYMRVEVVQRQERVEGGDADGWAPPP